MDGDDNVELILSMDMNGGTYAAYTDGSGNFIYYGANNEGALMIDLYVTDLLITSGTFTIGKSVILKRLFIVPNCSFMLSNEALQ